MLFRGQAMEVRTHLGLKKPIYPAKLLFAGCLMGFAMLASACGTAATDERSMSASREPSANSRSQQSTAPTSTSPTSRSDTETQSTQQRTVTDKEVENEFLRVARAIVRYTDLGYEVLEATGVPSELAAKIRSNYTLVGERIDDWSEFVAEATERGFESGEMERAVVEYSDALDDWYRNDSKGFIRFEECLGVDPTGGGAFESCFLDIDYLVETERIFDNYVVKSRNLGDVLGLA